MSTTATPTPDRTFAQSDGVEYTHENIQVLRDAAHIRQRPDMYIGNTGPSGLHHLVYELVYNSIDEALAGYCKNIHVKLNLDGSVTVDDDGRGIPVDLHPKENKPTLEVVLTMVGAGGKFDGSAYKVSAGLHGMGAKAVTALSEWTEARVRRDGKTYQQEYERGKAVSLVEPIGPAKGTGTTITFMPDREIFHDQVNFSFETLEERLRELAFLNRGIAITLTDDRPGQKKETAFQYAGGIAEFVAYLDREEDVLHEPIYISKASDTVQVEVALQYTAAGEDERVRCYANNAYNPSGGTHLSGFRSGLTRTLNAYGTKEGLFKSDLALKGEDFREGLTAIVSVQVPDPSFEAQTKVRFNNPEVEGAVIQAINEQLSKYLEENPKDAQRIIKKVMLAAEAREAAAKARQDLQKRKSILSAGGLPGKLMDCTTRDREESELFLVEGDSAGGSAESGRDRMYQAILPLRGKPLNVEKARLEALLNNSEIVSIISAVGVDIGNPEDVSRLRYGKIVILTDADVDGQHIRTLLLTFFFRQMRKLVEDGRIFVARPPLYKVTEKKKARFVQTAPEMSTELMARGLRHTKLSLLAGPAPKALEGDRLGELVKVLAGLEEPTQILERRGLSLSQFLPRGPGAAAPTALPMYRVFLGPHEEFFRTMEEVNQFREREQARLGQALVVADEAGAVSADGGEQFSVTELHEVRGLNKGLDRLAEFGLGLADLVPVPRVAGREPPVRYNLESGDQKKTLPHLRDLVMEVRRVGERGLAITRFKGLGEMDPEELWATTLNPADRQLLQVNLEDAFQADQMFRILMGEKVEPRREFIQKHALEVKEIDYHGA
jgi:DNA gyrase subunit B